MTKLKLKFMKLILNYIKEGVTRKEVEDLISEINDKLKEV